MKGYYLTQEQHLNKQKELPLKIQQHEDTVKGIPTMSTVNLPSSNRLFLQVISYIPLRFILNSAQQQTTQKISHFRIYRHPSRWQAKKAS